MNRRALVAMLSASAAAPLTPARSAEWPSRTGRIVVPYPAGGATDVVGRFAAEVISQRFGQRFVVDNKGGASGMIGAADVERAEPDGYTLLVASPATHVTNAFLRDRLPYDPEGGFAPVAMLSRNALLVVVPAESPFHSLGDLIDAAKRRPGALNYGSAGIGATSHLAAELLKKMAGIEMTHVPYRGAGPALNDLVGGQIQLMIDHTSTSLPQVQGGRVRALAVTSRERLAALLEVPTAAETVPGYEAMAFLALVAPRDTPPAIVERVNVTVEAGMQAPEIKRHLDALSVEPGQGRPDDVDRFLQSERTKWGGLIRELGIREP